METRSAIPTAGELAEASSVTRAQEHLAESMRAELAKLAEDATIEDVIAVAGDVAAVVVREALRLALARLGV